MRELFYLKDELAILNYTKSYPLTFDEVLETQGFMTVLQAYFKSLKKRDIKQYEWLFENRTEDEVVREMIHLLKALVVFKLDEIISPYLNEPKKMQYFIEDLYNFWRHTKRFSLITTRTATGLQLANFIEADARFNQLVLTLYRTIEERLQGKKNTVYRQLNAGTNACIVTRDVPWRIPDGYEQLHTIPFIDSMMLRTPLILHPKTNKREGTFDPSPYNPIQDFTDEYNDWFCFPAKVGELIAFVFFHRDFMASGVSLANLFELAGEEDYQNRTPDILLMFGVKDGKNSCRYYFDDVNQMYVGSVSYADRISYFGYIKKMTLTLHNLFMMRKGKLPIHGAMVNITLKSGQTKGVIFIGDSGAGKSETIEALRLVGDESIAKMDVIFDDMGSISLMDGQLYAQGTEIGAFVRLDDLEKGTAYRDMDRSIFMNPESSNARVILPTTPYEEVVAKHTIDMVLYANNYDDVFGMIPFHSLQVAKETFKEGKRFALGTTHEYGLTQTYFANPFGPMQMQDECNAILDRIFAHMNQEGILLGEIYTRLGIDHGDHHGIQMAAKALLAYLEDQCETNNHMNNPI